VQSIESGLLEVSGLTGGQIGEIALEAGIVISELAPLKVSLERAFMSLTGDAIEYHADAGEGNKTAVRATV
jgi:ABC-2 type transport system ATP-binding protein